VSVCSNERNERETIQFKCLSHSYRQFELDCGFNGKIFAHERPNSHVQYTGMIAIRVIVDEKYAGELDLPGVHLVAINAAYASLFTKQQCGSQAIPTKRPALL
jgi:hypothetical protein